MGTISSALSLISSALDAEQAALDVVSNNVANASNTSYTREVPNWAENPPIFINGISYGAGVTMTGGISQRDSILDQRLQQQTQANSGSTALLAALTSLQSSFPVASGTGTSGDIGTDITSFFNSFSQLEANPTSNPLRQQVLSSASTLAGDLSSAATSLNQQQSSLDSSAVTVAGQVNSLTASLAQTNLQIQSFSPGQDAGAFEDQRQSDLNQLANLIGFNQVSTENNGLSITTPSGQLLVSEGSSVPITTGTVNGVTHFFAGGADITTALASGGGQIGGLLTARDQNIPTVLSSLDQLAYGIATQVNTVNNAGTDMAGDNGNAGNIFNAPLQVAGSAEAMAMVMTDPNHIAAAGLGLGIGDDSNAVVSANLGKALIIGGQSPTDFYSNLVSTLGDSVSETTNEGKALTASVTQLQSQVSSLSAVNLDEEAANMQQFQRSYQAASQAFTILNGIMGSAINMGVETAVS